MGARVPLIHVCRHFYHPITKDAYNEARLDHTYQQWRYWNFQERKMASSENFQERKTVSSENFLKLL